MLHTLKVYECYFQAIMTGDKTFEIRNNHKRDFQRGDGVELREIKDTGAETGTYLMASITYVTSYEQKPDHVVFGFKVEEDA